MDKQDLAVQYHHQGYSCSQSVIKCFVDDLNIDSLTAYKLTEVFCRGVYTRENMCGACTAGLMCVSYKYSGDETQVGKTKVNTIQKGAKYVEDFTKANGGIICKDLFSNREKTCDDRIREAVKLVEQYLEKE